MLRGVVAAAILLLARTTVAAPCETPLVRYAFQPDCYRATTGASCDRRKASSAYGVRLDLGPQIAVWVEAADGSRFVDTLMVTNATAIRGLGNRPGHWSLPSSPKFPYGKRPMALPVWAHRRGVLYETTLMQDAVRVESLGPGPLDQWDKEYWLGFHEGISSPDPYYCRPMTEREIDVDAITCPTVTFNSAKGRLDPAMPRSYYPPRNDLATFIDRDCDTTFTPKCADENISARRYATMNDLDAVARPTPPYGAPYRGVWFVPAQVPDGDYALYVEVNKEFDNNAYHGAAADDRYKAWVDPLLEGSGLTNNFGQPSVVFRVPFTLDRGAASQTAVTAIAGYGDWNGATGTLHPADATISDGAGSGAGRFVPFTEASLVGGLALSGRVHVLVESGDLCNTGGDRPDGGSGCDPAATGEILGLAVPMEHVRATEVQAVFIEPRDGNGGPVVEYDIRVWEGGAASEAAFRAGTSAALVTPGVPGSQAKFSIADLKPSTTYGLGAQARGRCLTGPIAYTTFTTVDRRFTRLGECFVATAAHGSAMALQVNALRRVRDHWLRSASLGALATRYYERSSPPVATAFAKSDVGRAVARRALAALVGLAFAVEKIRASD